MCFLPRRSNSHVVEIERGFDALFGDLLRVEVVLELGDALGEALVRKVLQAVLIYQREGGLADLERKGKNARLEKY